METCCGVSFTKSDYPFAGDGVSSCQSISRAQAETSCRLTLKRTIKECSLFFSSRTGAFFG